MDSIQYISMRHSLFLSLLARSISLTAHSEPIGAFFCLLMLYLITFKTHFYIYDFNLLQFIL